ncbi:MAG: hypothetical protein IJU40_00010, partial [Desulfovibrionaceae bacterium]|nr:hypothetical protein [Desulfovibrionaceae bacterium]
ETILIKEPQKSDNIELPECIKRTIAQDILQQKVELDEKEFKGSIEYFGNFKLNFAQEIILPSNNLSNNIVESEEAFLEFSNTPHPINMPWNTERPMFLIPGELNYYDILDNNYKIITDVALYWILSLEQPTWTVNVFIKLKETGKWNLCPFIFSVNYTTDFKTGFGCVKNILYGTYLSTKLLNSPSFKDNTFLNQTHVTLMTQVIFCVSCLTELNFGRAYLLGQLPKKSGLGYELPNKAAIYKLADGLDMNPSKKL